MEEYQKLISDDEKWLYENTKDCLERKHILMVLWHSVPFPCEDASNQPLDSDGKKPWRSTEDLLSGEITEDVCKVFMDWLGDPTKPASFELKTSIYIAVQGRFKKRVEIL